jgi:hypothetical protein
MSAKPVTPIEETIPIKEAKREVEIACERIGLLHLAYAKTLVKELGEEQGKHLIMNAIKDYGKRCGERVRERLVAQGLDPIPENYETFHGLVCMKGERPWRSMVREGSDSSAA